MAIDAAVDFHRSLLIQVRIIGALVMREVITRYGRHNIGFMWMFAEPMMFTLGVAALWTFGGGGHNNMPVIPFAVTGYSSVLLWRNMPGRCSGAVAPNLALMYHRNVKIIDIYASRIILEFCGATLSFTILSLFFIAIDVMSFPADTLKVIMGWFMLSWFGTALAVTVGALAEIYEFVEKVWHPITYLTFPLSGTMFMVDWLPTSIQSVVLYLPMVHGLELLREGYYGSAVTAHYDMSYMAIICLCLTLFGLTLAREVGRRVMPE
ncbi:MAG: ABC transporter permease [Methylococcales bacterium]|nr:ABC transporter permease [Methylococcales bacterium]